VLFFHVEGIAGAKCGRENKSTKTCLNHVSFKDNSEEHSTSEPPKLCFVDYLA